MKSKAASRIASALIYAQGLLVVTAVAAVVMRLPANETSAVANQPVVASLAADTVAQ